MYTITPFKEPLPSIYQYSFVVFLSNTITDLYGSFMYVQYISTNYFRPLSPLPPNY